MSAIAVARKDFRDAVRSRLLWALSAIFLLLAGGLGVAYTQFEVLHGGNPTPEGVIYFSASTIGIFVALAALLACYKSITGERESGTIKVMLSLPHSRGEVLLGKLIGRSAVLAIPVVGTLLIGAILGGAMLGEFAPVATVLLAVLALFFTVAYVSVYVGFSAMTGSGSRAALLAVGFFFIVEMFWSAISLAVVFVTNGMSFPTEFPGWFYLVNNVPPSVAFTTSLEAVLPGMAGVITTGASTGGGGGGSAIDPSQFEAIYATPWIGIVILAIWAVVPILIGYGRFKGADL